MSDESLLGLLLRAHAGLAAQSHGEQYVFNNIAASNHFEAAYKSVESAIRSLAFAEQYVSQQGDRSQAKKTKRVVRFGEDETGRRVLLEVEPDGAQSDSPQTK